MSILDPEEKIDEDLQITISKRAFREALEDAKREMADKFMADHYPLFTQLVDDVRELENRLITTTIELEETRKFIKRYDLYVRDPELDDKIKLIKSPENFQEY